MKQLGIKAQWVKKSTVTTESRNFSNELKNILNRRFNPDHPNAVWCSDITYIYNSRKIIAWTLTRTMEAEEVLKCIEKAKTRLNTDSLAIEPLILHTDRGNQYTSKFYEKLTIQMKRSYSQKGVPQDNACIESFHSLLKREWLNRYKIDNYQQSYQLCYEYIENFYNKVRIHSHCEYESPNDYELLWQIKKNQEKSRRG